MASQAGCFRSGPIHPADPRHCCLITGFAGFNPRPLHAVCDRSDWCMLPLIQEVKMESSLKRRRFQASRKQSFRTVHGAALIVLAMSVLPVCPALQEQKGESSAANPLYEPVRALSGKTGYVNSLALSANGKFLALACDDGKVRLWNFASGEEIRTLTGHR
jgi:WD40 repeat protein